LILSYTFMVHTSFVLMISLYAKQTEIATVFY
jgi:hypothetical protein